MSIASEVLLNALRTIAPRELEEDWDNGGYQINMGNTEVKRILISLEITGEVIEEAVKRGADFIVTHHPLFFHKLDVIDAKTMVGGQAIELIRHGITLYSAHTCFDSAFGGNNDYLANLLDLQKIRKLKVWTPRGDQELMGRMGEFREPCTLREAADLVERVLRLKEHVRLVGNPGKSVKRVALCTGAGGDAIEALSQGGCDLYITGDVKHHQAQMAKEMGLALIDAGHYGTESIFVENFSNQLRKITEGQVEILESNIIVNPFDTMVY